MMKLVNLKKLKEDYPDVKARMVLPGGLDVNRVTLPVILTSNQGHDQQSTAVLTPEKTKKNKTAGLFGMFKSFNSSSEQQQEPNNATGTSALCENICTSINLSLLQKYQEDLQPAYRVSPSQLSSPRQDSRDKIR